MGLGNVGGFANGFPGYYWSSTEDDTFNAWLQNFDDGFQLDYNKGYSNYVRAVRAF